MTMREYAIQDVSKKLRVSKETLRYYDKIDLITPKRGENAYRYYTAEDILDLKYLQVMKFAGFSLAEIRAMLINKNNREISRVCKKDTLDLLAKKKKEALNKIEALSTIVDLIDVLVNIIEEKEGGQPESVDDLVNRTYRIIKSNE